MVTYHKDIEQNTEEWYSLRRGIITASVAGKLITPTGKVANNETVRQLAYSLAAERITGRSEPHFQTHDMARGHIQEVFARDLYSEKFAQVTQCGFIENNLLGFRVGYSPDGLVGEEGLIEIKSRLAKFQVETILEGEVPKEYMSQLQFGLLVSGRPWIDFIQYSNGMALFTKRVYHDDQIFGILIEAVTMFEKRVNEIIGDYKKASAGMPVAEYIEFADGSEIETND